MLISKAAMRHELRRRADALRDMRQALKNDDAKKFYRYVDSLDRQG